MPILDKSVKTKMLPAAWVLLVFGFVVLFVLGFIFGDGVLLVLSLMAVLTLLLSFLIGRLNIAKMTVQVKIPGRVFAGKGFDAKLYLDNQKGRFDAFGIEVQVDVMHQLNVGGYASWVPSREGAKIVRRISVPLRGSVSSMKVKLFSTFPLGLFEHLIEAVEPHSLVVYPRLITPIEVMSFGAMNAIDPQRGIQLGEAPGEPRGIRAWQPGDSVKRIHWAASARSIDRGQGIRVREYDPPGFAPSSCMVLFHSHAMQGEVYRHDRFERACSLAAGTLHFLHSRQVKAAFTADFLGWGQIDCENRALYIELLAIFAQAERAVGTMQHDLQSVIDDYAGKVDQLVIVSDMDPDTWSEGLDMPENTLVIDIRQMRFGSRSLAKAS